VTADRVLELLATLQSVGVDATLDGGWGVDALLGRQTRPHQDLDLVVALGDVPRIQEALRPLGFTLHEDHLPVRFVLRRDGEQLDFHTVTFDPEGGGVQPQPGGGSFRYPPEGFVTGQVHGVSVPCTSAPVQLLCHLGYEPSPEDAHDVLQLCRAFELRVPEAYARFLVKIEPYDDSRIDAIVRLSLRAWEPVFASIASAMDPEVYREQHPDWRVTQREAVESVCADAGFHKWVAADGPRTLGFVALRLHTEDRMGEIYMIAVDPDFQRRGIAAALTEHSLAWLRRSGMTTVMVETGGDPGHAPARRTYESAGFRLFPVARYFKKL
jgi:ribosomal protein S18 acetylase RimI-like enzyme